MPKTIENDAQRIENAENDRPWRRKRSKTIENAAEVIKNAAETIENLPDINNLDSSTVVRTSYEGDSGIQDVTLITMDGAGHTEPSISEQYSGIYEAIAGIQNHDIEMAEIVWEFFKDKSR